MEELITRNILLSFLKILKGFFYFKKVGFNNADVLQLLKEMHRIKRPCRLGSVTTSWYLGLLFLTFL